MPDDDNTEQRAYERAHKRVEELSGFYAHLLSYLAVMTGLFIINMLTSRQVLWFLYPLVGWGVFVLLHAVTTFTGGPFSRQWQERKTRELMEQERSRMGPRPPQPQAR